jgi:hypothetical protein
LRYGLGVRKSSLLSALIFAFAPSVAIAQHDLTVASVTGAPADVSAQDVVTVSAMLSNGMFSGNIEYRFYLSADAALDGSDYPAADGTIFVTWPSSPISADFTMPSTLTPGIYYVIAEADPNNLIFEPNETNNTAVSAGTIELHAADLQIMIFQTPSTAVIGQPVTVSLTIANGGVGPANGFNYEYSVNSSSLFLSPSVSVGANSSQTFTDSIVFSGPPGTVSVFVVVDVFSQVPEATESNNIGYSAPITLIENSPDLTGQIMEATAAMTPGANFAATSRLTNIGIADSGVFQYGYYLSPDPLITTSDRLIGTFSAMLAVQQDITPTDNLQIPFDVPNGTFHLGLIIDPAAQIDEGDETNNIALGPSFSITGSEITFATREIPDGILNQPYAFEIVVVSLSPATLRVASGALPDGLFFDSGTNEVVGTPSREGNYTFTLRAESASAFAEQEYSMTVRNSSRLEIATDSLPSGRHGETYSTMLTANGGTPPYVWSTTSVVPAGVVLDPDGRIYGLPEGPASTVLLIGVRDAVGDGDVKELPFEILPADAVIIVESKLMRAKVGIEYCSNGVVGFEARGGVKPYTWSLVTDAPPGLTLSPSGGICGVPSSEGLFAMEVRVADTTGLFDTARFSLEIDPAPPLTKAAESTCGCNTTSNDNAGGVLFLLLSTALTVLRPRRLFLRLAQRVISPRA